MNHEQMITEIQDHIDHNDGLLELTLDGLVYLRPTTVQISREGITTDPGDLMRSDFYSFEELPDSDLEDILTQIELIA